MQLLANQKIDALRRCVQGEKIKDIAKAYNCHPAQMSRILIEIILSQMPFTSDEFDSCLMAKSKARREVWAPLALQRLEHQAEPISTACH